MPSPIINLHNYPNIYLSTCILFLLLQFSIIVYIFVCSLCFIVLFGPITTRLNKYYYYYYYYYYEHRRQFLFRFYFTCASRCLFNVLKTLKQLCNAETICSRVLFQFYFILREPLNPLRRLFRYVYKVIVINFSVCGKTTCSLVRSINSNRR